MVDAAQETPVDLQRKLKLTIGAIVIPFVTATSAWLWLGKMDAAQWIGLVQWLVPLCLAAFVAGNAADKFAARP